MHYPSLALTLCPQMLNHNFQIPKTRTHDSISEMASLSIIQSGSFPPTVQAEYVKISSRSFHVVVRIFKRQHRHISSKDRLCLQCPYVFITFAVSVDDGGTKCSSIAEFVILCISFLFFFFYGWWWW